MRRKARHGDDEAEINITPMLDIVFIMLIFFIVTNAPVKEQKLSEVIAIEILPTGEILVKKRLTDIRAVRANIESALASQPEATVVVISDRDADAGLLVQVIDQARVAGAENVSLAAMAR